MSVSFPWRQAAEFAPEPPPEYSHEWRRVTRAYRQQAFLATIGAGGRDLGWQRAEARATFYWPDRRRRDIRNAEHSLKPAYDGLVDAGLITDDNSDVLTHRSTRFVIDSKRPRVEIEVERI